MARQITAITPQKRNRNRYNVYIDDEYAFSVSSKIAMTLHAGQPVDENRLESLKRADEREQAFERSLHYLSFRARSRKEIVCYLEKRGFGPEAARSAISRLEDYGYIDDEAFAALWIESRRKHRPRGSFALRHELAEKGVEKTIIDQALGGYDESGAARDAVSKKILQWSGLPEWERKAKIYNFLKQRGFSFETCREVSDWEGAGE